jgi:3-oxoacyl-[acyl-carrier protein] reductase
MNLDLSGKHALVGGSSQGLGKASAIELALLGANITLMARDENRLKATLAVLDRSFGQEHRYIVVDFTQPNTLKQAVEKLVAEHPVHILVNNTGGPPAGAAHTAQPNDYLSAFQNHLICNQILMQTVLEGMKAASFGRIINIISTSVKQPLDNLGVSNTIRGAVANWAKTLANELAQFGITVNNVLPGATYTARLETIIQNNALKKSMTEDDIIAEMEQEVPARRIGEAHEVGAAVAFLASPAAAYINGINLPVDGGRTRSL